MLKSEIRDNMRIDWDAPIAIDDGLVLHADVFRPVAEGKYPVILSYGPYAKGLAFQEGYKGNWARLIRSAPEVLQGSSNKYQSWELIDPEKWVPDGYVCLRVDSRGAGRSPGFLDVWSPRESQDIYECVEWAGTQSWSNGKVGINGISYYAMNQWTAGALKPPHPPCASGKARRTTTANCAGMAAFSAIFSIAGIRARLAACSTVSATAAPKAR